MAETAKTEVPGSPHREQFPPFNAQTFPSQLIWLTIFFILLYVMVAKYAGPRVEAIFAARRDRIASDEAEAERLRDRSEAAIGAYNKALADARARAQALANERRERQNAEAEARRKSLEERLNVELAEAEKSIAATKTAAMNNVRSIAEDAAGAIVQRLIGSMPSSDATSAAVASVLRRR